LSQHRRSPVRRAAWVIAASLLAGAPAALRADVLTWDGNGPAAPNPAGGDGLWSAAALTWWNGAANQAYSAGSAPHDVTFDTAPGIVTITGPVAAGTVNFNVTGYAIGAATNADALTLANPGWITVAPAVTATIAAPIAGTVGLTKLGAGTLTLDAVERYAGPTTILAGTVKLGALADLPDAFGVSLAASGAALDLDGTNETIGTLGGVGGSSVILRGGRLSVSGSSNFDGTISDGGTPLGGRLVKEGAGTLLLSGTNTYSGRTTITGGAIRITSNAALGSTGGGNTADVELDGGTLIVGGGSNISTGREFEIGMRGGTLDIQNSGTSGLTLGDSVRGSGALLKTGTGVLRFDSTETTLTGGIAVANGTLRVNSVTDNAPASFRMNRITLESAGQLIINTSTAPELRTGEISGSGLVSVRDATATARNYVIYALADATFSGSVTNSSLTVRGAATQTITGTLDMSGSITVGHGAGLTLGGTAAIPFSTGVNLRGGAFTLDNAAANNGERYGNLASVDSRGGGSFTLVGNANGTTETVGQLFLNSGALDVRLAHAVGAGADTFLAFGTVAPLTTTTGTVNFAATGGTLGAATPAPRATLAAQAAGLIGPFATVNGADFAAYDATAGVVAAPTVALAAATAADVAHVTANATIAGGDRAVAALKLAPAAPGATLDLADASHLVTRGVLLAGTADFEIRATGPGPVQGAWASDAIRFAHVAAPTATLTVSAPVIGLGGLVKSGEGTLALTAANDYAGATTINAGTLRASPGVGLPTASTAQLRGGVLELTGGGTFSRNLGTNAAEINWQTASTDRGGGGFAARGADVTIDLGAPGVDTFTWEQVFFVESGYAFTFGSRTADARVTFADGIALNGGITGVPVGQYNAREIHVIDNPNSAADVATIAGPISSAAFATERGNLGDLLKTGDGALELAGPNTYVGGTIVAEGSLLLGHPSALGDAAASRAYVLVGNRGGAADAALLTSAAVAIDRDLTVQAGSSGTVTLGGTGAFASSFSGNIELYKSVRLTADAGGHTTFTKAFTPAPGATIALTKVGAGTVTIDGDNTYTGGTTVLAGTLVAASLPAGAVTVGNGATPAELRVGRLRNATLTVANGAKAALTGDGQVTVFSSLDLGVASGLLETGTNHFVIDLGATATEAAARAAYQQVRQWFLNQSDAINPNQGIRPANADNLHWLTILNNQRENLASWQGVDLDEVLGHRNAIVAMWTWKGDLNADGRLTGDDYFTIDGNLNAYDPLTG